MEDQLASLLLQMATPTAVTYGLTEAAGKSVSFLKKVPQDTLAIGVGPLVGLGCFALGWIDPGSSGYFGAAGLGLASAVIAGFAHDYVVNPLLPKKIKEKANGA